MPSTAQETTENADTETSISDASTQSADNNDTLLNINASSVTSQTGNAPVETTEPPCSSSPIQKHNMSEIFSKVFKNISDEKDSDLHYAARFGHLQMMVKAVENTPESDLPSLVNKRNHLGATALWLAAVEGHEEIVDYLCKLECTDLELSNIKAQTPLFAASKMNNKNCLRVLLEAGANPDGDDQNLTTPIYIAARENYFEIVQLLAEYGADVNGRMRNEQIDDAISHIGSVPIYITLVYRCFESFRYLILHGANLNATSNEIGNGSSLLLTILRYHCDVRYLRLVALCGGIHVTSREELNRIIATYEHMTGGYRSDRQDCIEFLKTWISHPLSLSSICRGKIRQSLGQKLKLIKQLNLPDSLQDFIEYKHILV